MATSYRSYAEQGAHYFGRPHESLPPDLYEGIANEPEIRLDMELAPGDVQLVSNHTVIHARTAYEDAPDSVGRRHLLRLWLSL